MVSRNRRYQIRKEIAGICKVCTKPVQIYSLFCEEHRVKRVQYQRNYRQKIKNKKGA